MRRATSGVTRVPFGDITTRRPVSTPRAAMSNTSSRMSGSPPVRIRIGSANEAI
jgi:hypothetical protein